MIMDDLNLYSAEAESGVLGALLLLGSGSVVDQTIDELSPAVFGHQYYRQIFTAISSLRQQGVPCDLLTTRDYLTNAGSDNAAFSVLGDLVRNTPSTANIRGYAQLLRDKSAERAVFQSLQQAIADFAEARTTDARMSVVETALAGVQTQRGNESGFMSISDIADTWLTTLERRMAGDTSATGSTFGLGALDELVGRRGVQPTDMVVIGARPKMGKTTLALRMAEHAAVDLNEVTLVFSMEMSQEQVLEKSLSQMSGVSTGRFYGPMSDNDFGMVSHSLNQLADTRLFVDDSASLTLQQVVSRCREMKATYPGQPGKIFLDYFTLMKTNQAERNDLAYGEISKGLKALAKELGWPVILLAQLSRSVDSRTDKRPILSDLRETGQIEQDADVVMFLYNDTVYYPDSPAGDMRELLVRANRHGRTGTVYFDMTDGRIEPLSVEAVARRHHQAEQEPFRPKGQKPLI